jgi:two-component system KDP operon response regulator KdpE
LVTASGGNRVLIVDDEAAIRRILKVCLTSSGYVVHETASGHEAIKAVAEIRPDIVLLDLGLPDIDGSRVVTRIREFEQCPVLILSVRGQESDKVAVLDAGADDYLTKPFGNRELLARVRALLRRGHGQEATTVLRCGRIAIDPVHHRVEVCGKPIRLSRTEYALLKCLAQRHGNIATHHQLVREVWGKVYNEHALHVLHVTIGNLRRKIEDDPLRPQTLVTEPGIGYRIETQP